MNVDTNWEAMHMSPAWLWAKTHGTTYDLNETHRVGQPAFNFLLQMFPDELSGVECKKHDPTSIIWFQIGTGGGPAIHKGKQFGAMTSSGHICSSLP